MHHELAIFTEDFDLNWPNFAVIYVETSNLTEIPPSLVRLAPYDLSLALNLISSVLAALVESSAVIFTRWHALF